MSAWGKIIHFITRSRTTLNVKDKKLTDEAVSFWEKINEFLSLLALWTYQWINACSHPHLPTHWHLLSMTDIGIKNNYSTCLCVCVHLPFFFFLSPCMCVCVCVWERERERERKRERKRERCRNVELDVDPTLSDNWIITKHHFVLFLCLCTDSVWVEFLVVKSLLQEYTSLRKSQWESVAGLRVDPTFLDTDIFKCFLYKYSYSFLSTCFLLLFILSVFSVSLN